MEDMVKPFLQEGSSLSAEMKVWRKVFRMSAVYFHYFFSIVSMNLYVMQITYNSKSIQWMWIIKIPEIQKEFDLLVFTLFANPLPCWPSCILTCLSTCHTERECLPLWLQDTGWATHQGLLWWTTDCSCWFLFTVQKPTRWTEANCNPGIIISMVYYVTCYQIKLFWWHK